MSLTGKGTLSLRKKDVQQQKSAGTAYRRLMFAHKANAGETGINLTALVQPSEMAALGFVNPNAGDILAANILFYKKNLTVISSARGILMQDLSYTVPTSSRIEFQGFTALQDEIFTCVLETGVKDGLTLLDAAPLVSTGTLLAGQTDYNVGTPFKVGEYINSQHGAVMVSVDGQLMLRNTSNQPAGVGIQGDYYEVNNGSGLGTIIRFNTPDLINDRSVSVVSIGSLVERPDGSMTAAIESLAGQIDQMIPTLAAVAGVPENTFQGAPNNQDLKAFGDRVLSLEQSTDARLDTLEETSSLTNATAYPATAAAANLWFDMASLTLTPGEWDIFVVAVMDSSSAVNGTAYAGVSTTPGNVTAGILGTDMVGNAWNGNAGSNVHLSWHRLGVVVPSGTQTWYAKGMVNVANGRYGCRMSARRIKKG